MLYKSVLINELRDAFISLKITKSPADEIGCNIINKCFSELCKPFKHVFNLTIETGVFPDKLKIARVSRVYKLGDSSDFTNYWPISALPCSPKILEILMYNYLFPDVSQEKVMYSKQIGIKSGHLTEHAIL